MRRSSSLSRAVSSARTRRGFGPPWMASCTRRTSATRGWPYSSMRRGSMASPTPPGSRTWRRNTTDSTDGGRRGARARFPFRPASFDHAIAFGILHFLPNWGEAIREIARVIRTLVASTTGGMRDTEVGSRYVSALRAHGWEAVEQPGLSADGLAQRVSPTLRFPKIVHESEEATDALIDRFDNRGFTWQWEIPDGIHAAPMAGLRDALR